MLLSLNVPWNQVRSLFGSSQSMKPTISGKFLLNPFDLFIRSVSIPLKFFGVTLFFKFFSPSKLEVCKQQIDYSFGSITLPLMEPIFLFIILLAPLLSCFMPPPMRMRSAGISSSSATKRTSPTQIQPDVVVSREPSIITRLTGQLLLILSVQYLKKSSMPSLIIEIERTKIVGNICVIGSQGDNSVQESTDCSRKQQLATFLYQQRIDKGKKENRLYLVVFTKLEQ